MYRHCQNHVCPPPALQYSQCTYIWRSHNWNVIYALFNVTLIHIFIANGQHFGNFRWKRKRKLTTTVKINFRSSCDQRFGCEMGKSQIKSHSKISKLRHWRFKSSSQISNLESNLTPKSWILKLQISNQISNNKKAFKHISILLVISLISINVLRKFVNVSS